MEGDFIKINKWLLPLSWLYGAGVKLRNALFEVGLLKSRPFRVPVIAVGNITVGGTGKTPHVEYLVDMLRSTFHVAVLSRGYKRKSRGFVQADSDTAMPQIGDEPFQMKQKFPDVTIAVDKDRCHGISRLCADDETLDVILLDDAFQHRYVKPGINILLVDYHRLIIYDRLLPAGRLREPLNGKNRADVVIITKCPKNLKPMEYRVITKAMSLYPYQTLYFTTLDYGPLRPLFAEGAAPPRLSPAEGEGGGLHVLLLTGIASPEQLIHDLTSTGEGAGGGLSLSPLSFADHHRFRPKDVRRINEAFAALPAPRCIITTEKDATRLYDLDGLSADVRRSLYVLPVWVTFLQDQEQKFNENIINYVRKNSRNSILVKGQDDHPSHDSHRAGDGPRTISFRNH